ncbi:MAG: glutamate racemase [Flavobacteriales bacterium]
MIAFAYPAFFHVFCPVDSRNNAIGVFDSGIGGLTVLKAIHESLPNEDLIYFGDTAHMPYGDKSADLIAYYSEGITRFLLQNHCKMIVIACNTASAYGYKKALEAAGTDIPVVNVVDPSVDLIINDFAKAKIGVIGTKGTINSGIYKRKLNKSSPLLEVVSQATPLLAPMIEEGFFNNKISRTIINAYLSKKSFEKIDAILLACTHYPLIKKEIEEFYKGHTRVIDSAETVAQAVRSVLSQKELRAQREASGSIKAYVSDLTPAFEKSTEIFFNRKISLEKKNIWS